MERKRKWAKAAYPGQQRRKSDVLERGKTIGAAHPRGIAWLDAGPDLAWVCRFSYPYTQALSKNHIYAGTARGHRFLRSESRKAMDDIALLARSSLRGHKVSNNKVWVDILVQKKDHKSDAINVIDLVCDGLKVGIGLDDRWFCIRRLDWEISKTDPQIFIGFGQENVEDAYPCSSCGRILSFDHFRRSKAEKLGITRNCKDCLGTGRMPDAPPYGESSQPKPEMMPR